jgi:hypothetical protein
MWNDVRTLADGKALIDSNRKGTEDGSIEQVEFVDPMLETLG